eukprot:176339-Pyramimonas_sp.AAC.1
MIVGDGSSFIYSSKRLASPRNISHHLAPPRNISHQGASFVDRSEPNINYIILGYHLRQRRGVTPLFASKLYMVAFLQDVSSHLLLSSPVAMGARAPERCASCDLEGARSGDGAVEKDNEQYAMGSYRMMGEEYSRNGSPPNSSPQRFSPT